jgi:hypothetical protein
VSYFPRDPRWAPLLLLAGSAAAAATSPRDLLPLPHRIQCLPLLPVGCSGMVVIGSTGPGSPCRQTEVVVGGRHMLRGTGRIQRGSSRIPGRWFVVSRGSSATFLSLRCMRQSATVAWTSTSPSRGLSCKLQGICWTLPFAVRVQTVWRRYPGLVIVRQRQGLNIVS